MKSDCLLKPKTLEKVLIKLGFERLKQKGGHAIYKAGDGRLTSLPLQRGRNLAFPLVKEILKEIQISEEQLETVITELKSKN